MKHAKTPDASTPRLYNYKPATLGKVVRGAERVPVELRRFQFSRLAAAEVVLLHNWNDIAAKNRELGHAPDGAEAHAADLFEWVLKLVEFAVHFEKLGDEEQWKWARWAEKAVTGPNYLDRDPLQGALRALAHSDVTLPMDPDRYRESYILEFVPAFNSVGAAVRACIVCGRFYVSEDMVCSTACNHIKTGNEHRWGSAATGGGSSPPTAQQAAKPLGVVERLRLHWRTCPQCLTGVTCDLVNAQLKKEGAGDLGHHNPLKGAGPLRTNSPGYFPGTTGDSLEFAEALVDLRRDRRVQEAVSNEQDQDGSSGAGT